MGHLPSLRPNGIFYLAHGFGAARLLADPRLGVHLACFHRKHRDAAVRWIAIVAAYGHGPPAGPHALRGNRPRTCVNANSNFPRCAEVKFPGWAVFGDQLA